MCIDCVYKTSVYRIPTFTGQYLRWESFSPTKQKTNLISILVHRALMICTKSKLNEEIKHIKNILLDNGYPESGQIIWIHVSLRSSPGHNIDLRLLQHQGLLWQCQACLLSDGTSARPNGVTILL